MNTPISRMCAIVGMFDVRKKNAPCDISRWVSSTRSGLVGLCIFTRLTASRTAHTLLNVAPRMQRRSTHLILRPVYHEDRSTSSLHFFYPFRVTDHQGFSFCGIVASSCVASFGSSASSSEGFTSRFCCAAMVLRFLPWES